MKPNYFTRIWKEQKGKDVIYIESRLQKLNNAFAWIMFLLVLVVVVIVAGFFVFPDMEIHSTPVYIFSFVVVCVLALTVYTAFSIDYYRGSLREFRKEAGKLASCLQIEYEDFYI